MEINVSTIELNKLTNFAALSERSKADSDKYIDKVFVTVQNNTLTLERIGLHAAKKSKALAVEGDGKDFSFQVDYSAFKAVIGKVATRFDQVNIAMKGDELKINAGRIKTQLSVTELSKPEIEDDSTAQDEICVQTADFLSLIGQVRASSAKGDVRYYLNGICFQTDNLANNLLHAIATDGHRMAKGQCEFLAHEYEKERSVIVSNECVSYLDNILKDTSDKQVVLHLTSSFMSITLEDGTSIKMKIIDGRFPDWKRVVPCTHTGIVNLDRANFTESIRSAITLANPKFKGGRFFFKPSGCDLYSTSQIGSYEEVIEVQGFEGDDCEIGFNLEYVLSALNVIDDDSIVIRLNGSNGSAVIHGDNSDNTSTFHVVMPTRL
ncbi:DNA polymerase III subunit beta [Vibrio cyclitrophicus]|uniref:DNA polymerase III subunit beta n=1 Tax=Vibrio cyclitrophicus TaxID=47951 RepID=UPI0032E3D2C0